MTKPPLSPARRAGDLLFLSGQLGVADGALVEGGIAEETRQAIRNVSAILAENGAGLADVVKTTVFLATLADWPALNEVYVEFFDEPFPARSVIEAPLVAGALVEIEVVALAPVTA
jgi:2-iminobutanoate/2-iminopropanoate deaminase